jgi:hypothetical protein
MYYNYTEYWFVFCDVDGNIFYEETDDAYYYYIMDVEDGHGYEDERQKKSANTFFESLKSLNDQNKDVRFLFLDIEDPDARVKYILDGDGIKVLCADVKDPNHFVYALTNDGIESDMLNCGCVCGIHFYFKCD